MASITSLRQMLSKTEKSEKEATGQQKNNLGYVAYKLRKAIRRKKKSKRD